MTMSAAEKKRTIDRMAREVQRDYAKVRDLVSMSIEMIAACADAGCPDDGDAVQFVRDQGTQIRELRAGLAQALGLSGEDLTKMENLSGRLEQLVDEQLRSIATETTIEVIQDAAAVCEAAGSRQLPQQLRELAEGMRRSKSDLNRPADDGATTSRG